MNLKQVFGMFLLIGGVGAFIYGLSIQDSVEYKFVSTFGGDTSRVAFLMVGGIIASIVGVLLLVFGRDKESGEERPVRTAGQPRQSKDTLDVLQFDDEKLMQITESSGLYRPEIVEAGRRELELRRKCGELLPQVREKDDGQLREMTGNPALYTEELIRTARMVQDERRRLRLQEQERAEQAARLEREKQAEERRQRRIAARKRRRPYVLAVLALLVLAGAGTGYYAYRQKQERLAMERRAAEERRIAQEKKAAEERAAQERWAEERRLEEEKQRREAAARQAELDRLNSDVAYRNSKGIYRVGDVHKGEGGVVFRIDNTGKHGKVCITTTGTYKHNITWDEANNVHYIELPTVSDLQMIYKNRDRINKALTAAGEPTLKTEYGAHHWSCEKYGSASAWTISMYDGAKNSFYRHSYKANALYVASF